LPDETNQVLITNWLERALLSDAGGSGFLFDAVEIAEAATLSRHFEAARLATKLNEASHRILSRIYFPVCVARVLGECSALFGDYRQARAHYAKSFKVCERLRLRPEFALTRLDLAELFLAHYTDERDAAIEHLDFAISEFREIKMQPSLERALRHRGLLKA